jgi:hypothetical protein
MLRAFVIGAAFCTFAMSAFAQENLLGKWSGSYVYTGTTDMNIGLDLEITSVEGNVVKGVAKNYARACAGDYQMSGKIDGAILGMLSTNSGGAKGDCKLGFRVTVEGSKMTGKIGTYDLTFTKK